MQIDAGLCSLLPPLPSELFLVDFVGMFNDPAFQVTDAVDKRGKKVRNS